jgi:MoxR-like ATPase
LLVKARQRAYNCRYRSAATEVPVPVPIEDIQGFAARVRENVARVIVGKEPALDLLLVALLCGGHALLEDVPGVGKTMMARALAVSLGLSFRRLQCTL